MVAILCRFKSCYPHQAERHPIRVPFLFCAAGLLRRPGRAYPQFLRANCSPQAGCPADGAFSLSRLRVTGRGTSTVFACELLPAGWLPGRWGVFSVLDVCDRAGHIHNLCARIAPRRGEKIFRPGKIDRCPRNEPWVGASGRRGAHGTGLICSGAFSAKIDRCSRERLSPFFRFRSRKIHGKNFAEPRTDRTEPAGTELAIRKIRER